MIRFRPVEHYIEDRAHARLCDGRPASHADISSEDWGALRDVRSELYGMGRHSTAHLYAVPVLVGFDVIMNC